MSRRQLTPPEDRSRLMTAVAIYCAIVLVGIVLIVLHYVRHGGP